MSKKTLRQRVSTYFRQLSFIAEPRIPISNRRTGDEDFIRKYLDGGLPERPQGPSIQSGRSPDDMPEVELRLQDCVGDKGVVAFTGPDKGITTVQRSKLHLSAGSDIDFIDNNLESDFEVRRSKRANAQRFGGIVSGPFASRLHANRKSPEQEEDQQKGVENVQPKISLNTGTFNASFDLVAGIADWSLDSDYACGMSTSLYERNPISQDVTGSPIADCFALISRGDSCILALADGVNWGEKACLAARAALRGAVEYLETALFGLSGNAGRTMLTRDIFISLLRSLWEGHGCILEVGGALTTLTIAVVVPVARTNCRPPVDNERQKWMVCACNVGDSLGFVYSQRSGVREFTEASHDTTTARDMRDALGALGPVDGTKPDLSNLTLSMTEVEEDDIVFLTSDGVSDNFDPVVGKFAIAASETPDMDSGIKTRLKVGGANAGSQRTQPGASERPKLQTLLQQKQQQSQQPPLKPTSMRPQYSRSRTVIEPRRPENSPSAVASPRAMMHRSPSILPHVTAEQRHRLTLLRLEDLLAYGINGTLQPCNSAKKLCQLLIDFSRMITAARRNMLEQRETYVRLVADPVTGQRREAELNRLQQRAARKRVVDSTTFQSLPGKLDHASVVAFMCRRTEVVEEKKVASGSSSSGSSTKGGNPNRGMPLKSSAVIETDF